MQHLALQCKCNLHPFGLYSICLPQRMEHWIIFLFYNQSFITRYKQQVSWKLVLGVSIGMWMQKFLASERIRSAKILTVTESDGQCSCKEGPFRNTGPAAPDKWGLHNETTNDTRGVPTARPSDLAGGIHYIFNKEASAPQPSKV